MYGYTYKDFILLSLFKILILSRTATPTFLVEPNDQNIVRGETAVFKCTVTKDVASVYWYYSLGKVDGWLSVNSNLVSTLTKSKSERYSVTGNQTKGEYFLQIHSVSDEDVGDYKCFYYPVKSTGPNRTPEASLAIFDPPRKPICRINRPDTAIPSQTISLRCTSTGEPTPQLVWLKNGNRIEGNDPRPSLNMLSLNLTEDDSGTEFSCAVYYPKMLKPPTCKLTPLPVKPEVTVEPSVQTLVLNKTGKFVCGSTGIQGPLKYKWYVNGEVPSRMMVKEVHFRIKHDGKTFKILWVVQELDNTEIYCRVTGKDPNNPSEDLVRYGKAWANVSETEVVPTVIAVTLGGNTDGNTKGISVNGSKGGEYINGGIDKSSDFVNDSGVGEEDNSSNGTIIGVVLSMLILLALVIVLAIFLYKRNNEINKSGKRLSAQFMKCVSIKSASNHESNSETVKDCDTNDLYAKPVKSKKGSKWNETDENEQVPQSKPVVLPRLVSKKKENKTAEDTSCAVVETTTDAEISEKLDKDCNDGSINQDEIIEIENDCDVDSPVDADNKSETSKNGSLLRSIYAKLQTDRIGSFITDLRPKKPSRTFAESINRLRSRIIPKRKNKEDDDSVDDQYSAVNLQDNIENAKADSVQVMDEEQTVELSEKTNVVQKSEVEIQKSEVEIQNPKVEVQKSELEVQKSQVEVQKLEPDALNTGVDELEVTAESDDIPSSLPSENSTLDHPVVRRNRTLGAHSSSKSEKRSSLTLDNLLSNVKRRSLSRRFSGFENRGSTPDLRSSRRVDKNDIVHFVPLGKSDDMTGNVEVVKNRQSINFENEMSQTLLKSFHTVVPNQPQQLNTRIIEDESLYENLDDKENYDGSPYLTDEFSEDEFDCDEGKPVERVAPMRIIDDTPVYENTELKPLNDTHSNTDSSSNAVKFESTKQSKPTMRVKPTPTPRSFRRLNGSNSSPESQKNEHYKKLPSEIRKKGTIDDLAKDIDPTTGESIYDNVDYKL